MKALNMEVKIRVIELFFDGLSYDEIAEKVAIGKGSVANIAEDYREGRLATIPTAKEIDALRKLAVDLRKKSCTVTKAAQCLNVLTGLQRIGAPIEEAEQWLQTAQELASSSPYSNNLLLAAVELTGLQAKYGKSYEELLSLYQNQWDALAELTQEIARERDELAKLRRDKAEIDDERGSLKKALEKERNELAKEKARLNLELEHYLGDLKLSWEKIRFGEALFNSRTSSASLTEEQANSLAERITEARSLDSFVDQLQNQKKRLGNQVRQYAESETEAARRLRAIASEITKLEERKVQELSEITRRETEIKDLAARLAKLAQAEFDRRENLYISRIILEFLLAPDAITDYDFDRLLNIMLALRQKRLGISPKSVSDGQGRIICRCEVPKIDAKLDPNAVNTDHAREAFAYLLAPLISDKLVSRWELTLAETKHEVEKGIAVARATLEERQRHLI